ncbi:MAG: hypothetical protein PHI03_13430 [Bacteroidales bacterium]|nr:hypothetical protein [Bacteroidales bacterium]
MKLIKARVQNYRSIIDSGIFEIEELKTILVGPNEAGGYSSSFCASDFGRIVPVISVQTVPFFSIKA